MLSHEEFVKLMNTIRQGYGLPLLGKGDATADRDEFSLEAGGVWEDMEGTYSEPSASL